MTRDIIDINDFTILVETSYTDAPSLDSCTFEEPIIGVAFYGSGNVDLSVKYNGQEKVFHHTQGLCLSFYANDQVKFAHKVSATKPLESILIATAVSNLDQLPHGGGELFSDMLHQLVFPADHYVEGPTLFMPPEMQSLVEQVFHSRYEGKAKMMFFKSQMSTLLAHYFGQLSLLSEATIPEDERQRLQQAKDILTANLDSPPSLTELSRQIGLNTFKLKKNFKEMFGVPVFKYLQNERLSTAHDLIRNKKMNIQEAAWHVGYDSLSSFSNAFTKKFGVRPSEIRK